MTTRIWARLGNLSYRHLRKTLESNQIPEGTSRLAGGPYRHQGLSSVVLIIGLEPITSDVSGRRSHQLSYMSGCGQGRTRTFNHSINSRGLCHWATCPNNLNVLPNYTKEGLEPPFTRHGLFYRLNYWRIRTDIFHSWERRDSNPQGHTTTDLQSAEPTNCSTLPFVHPTGFEPVTCCM